VELSSGKEVADIIPDIHEIEKCPGRGVIVIVMTFSWVSSNQNAA
jgi:hypothetical protein